MNSQYREIFEARLNELKSRKKLNWFCFFEMRRIEKILLKLQTTTFFSNTVPSKMNNDV